MWMRISDGAICNTDNILMIEKHYFEDNYVVRGRYTNDSTIILFKTKDDQIRDKYFERLCKLLKLKENT